MPGSPDVRPRALLVDLDGTLLDGSGVPESIARTCDSIVSTFAGFDARELQQRNGEVWAAYWPEVEQSCWLGETEGFAVSREAWRRTLQACGCVDEAVVDFAFDQHRAFGREAHRLFADASILLECAAENRLPVALVTNGPSDLQRDKLRVLGLDAAVEVIVISGEVGRAKPDPTPFRLALKRLDIDSRDAWHVGDSLATDVGGARAAGLVSIWLNRSLTRQRAEGVEPDIEVGSLTGVVDLIRQAQSVDGNADAVE